MSPASTLPSCLIGVILVAVLACESPQAPARGDHVRADCYGCHSEDYQHAHGSRREPVPTTCAVCHREQGFHPTVRVHPWPLTGAHTETDCFACHDDQPPVYEGLPSACVDCHRKDYDESTYPGHDKFPLTCADCHSTEAFKPAKKPARKPERTASEPPPTKPSSSSASQRAHKRPASKPAPQAEPKPLPSEPAPSEPAPREREHPESKFPIRRGHHAEIACQDCHTGAPPNRKTNTDCVQCHKRTRYDRVHARVSDYPFDPAPAYFCAECHKQGTTRVFRH